MQDKLELRTVRRRAALAGAGWLVVVGLVLPFSIATAAGLTGLESSLVEYVIAGIIVLGGASGGGAAFTRYLGRLTGIGNSKRLGWAGALSFAPAAIAAGIVLGMLEPVAVGRGGAAGIPIHVVFAVLFTLATFLVVAVLGLAIGVGLHDARLGVQLGWRAGLAAALAFLAADVIQDLLGRRVGAPGAAATATMVTVTAVGLLAAAAATGAVLAPALGRLFRIQDSVPATRRESAVPSQLT